MPDSNPSSTKSPPPWAASIVPSKRYNLLLIALTLLALYAVWLCPLTLPIRLVFAGVVVYGSYRNWRTANTACQLAWTTDNRWHIDRSGERVSGHLASGCYRSRCLIILAVRDEVAVQEKSAVRDRIQRGFGTKGRLHRVMIWRDAIDADNFSSLQMRLALTPRHALQ